MNDEADRVANMQADGPARFLVNENPDADSWPQENDDPWRGWHAVRRNNAIIEGAAEKNGIDPDLIRAVMWAENTRSNSGGRDDIGDFLRWADTTMPMNINRDMWGSLINAEPSELREPRKNIEAGAALLRRITDRIVDPTAEKIGSVWNHSGRENVNDFGAFVGRVYQKKPWLGREPLRRGFRSETFP